MKKIFKLIITAFILACIVVFSVIGFHICEKGGNDVLLNENSMVESKHVANDNNSLKYLSFTIEDDDNPEGFTWISCKIDTPVLIKTI